MTAVPTTSPDRVRAELRQLWSDIVGPSDDDSHFFRLGGDSLQALRLLAAIRSRFGVTVGFTTLLEHASPAALADQIVRLAGEARAAGPQLRGDPRRQVAAVSVMQHDRLRKDQHYLDRGVPPPPHHVRAALRFSGALDTRALRRAVRQLPRRHPALRTVFEPAGSSWRQRLLPAAAAELPLRAHEAGEADLPEVLRELAGERFDLARGLPVRADLIRVAAADHVLLLTLEHLVSDGASLQVVLEDLAAAYRATAYRAGDSDQPPEPDRHGPGPARLSFLDYAHAESEWLVEHQGQPSLDHWRKALDGPTCLPYWDIPLGSPVRPHTTAPVRVESLQLEPALVRRLTEVAERADASWFTLIATAAHLAMGELTGREDIATVSPVANRHRPDIDRTVGWFANLVALTSTAAEREPAAGLVDTLRRRQLEALDHSEVPFWYVMQQLFGHDSRHRPDSSWIYVEVESAQPAAASPVLTGFPGLRVRRVPVPTLIAGRGLYLSATVGPSTPPEGDHGPTGVAVQVVGRQDRFSGEDLAQVRSAVVRALDSLGRQP